MGLPAHITRRQPQKKKTKTAAPAAKVKTMKHNKHAHEIERRTLAQMRQDEEQPTISFAHLLRAADLEERGKALQLTANAIARAPATPSGSKPPLTAAARKIIALGVELSGEAMQEEDIEARMRQDQDRAIGFTPEVRAIVDRAQKNKRRTQ